MIRKRISTYLLASPVGDHFISLPIKSIHFHEYGDTPIQYQNTDTKPNKQNVSSSAKLIFGYQWCQLWQPGHLPFRWSVKKMPAIINKVCIFILMSTWR